MRDVDRMMSMVQSYLGGTEGPASVIGGPTSHKPRLLSDASSSAPSTTPVHTRSRILCSCVTQAAAALERAKRQTALHSLASWHSSQSCFIEAQRHWVLLHSNVDETTGARHAWHV